MMGKISANMGLKDIVVDHFGIDVTVEKLMALRYGFWRRVLVLSFWLFLVLSVEPRAGYKVFEITLK